MCGIAGYIGGDVDKVDDQSSDLYVLMNRRGPDNFAKTIIDYKLLLVHSRLKIIDFSDKANQPFVSDKHAMIFNGEIYNYKEIREELGSSGVLFETGSDTEVLFKLLSSVENLTPDTIKPLLDKLEGMWAIAFYDRISKRLFLVRDRFGEKPLWYAPFIDGGLYFGSELKYLNSLMGVVPEVKVEHVERYLENGYRAIFKDRGNNYFYGNSQLEPGKGICFHSDTNMIEDFRYYSVKVPTKIDKSKSRGDYVKELKCKVLDAVGLSMASDVPLAFCVSGGVDSNTIVSVAKRVFDYDVHGFTIVGDDIKYNERDSVKAVVKELGIKHTFIPLSKKNFLRNMRKIIRYHEAPLTTISYYVHWLLMKEVGKNYKVVLSGTGGDELFAGYFDHWLYWFAEMKRTTTVNQQRWMNTLYSWKDGVLPHIRNSEFKDDSLFIRNPSYRGYLYPNNGYFFNEYNPELFNEHNFTVDMLKNRMLNELLYETVPPILFEDDLNSMFFSVENRSPFLDRELVDFIFSIPTEYFLRGGFNKSLLRDAMKGIVPDCVLLDKRKVGFNASLLDLFDVEKNDVWLFNDSPIYEIVNMDKIKKFFKGADSWNDSNNKFAFSFISAKIFLEEFE